MVWTHAARYSVLPTHIQTQLSFKIIGKRNGWARYRARQRGKNALVWTSKAYPHSTDESAGVECDGGDANTRFEKALGDTVLRNTETRNTRGAPKKAGYDYAHKQIVAENHNENQFDSSQEAV